MHSYHKTLLAEIKAKARKGGGPPAGYLRNTHHSYNLSAPHLRTIAKNWARSNRALDAAGFIAVLDSLFAGESYDEKIMATLLLGCNAHGRAHITTKMLDAWLDHLAGWAEIDALCSNVFKPDEVLGNWKNWERFIKRLARDENINKRRAALVFLTGPVRYSADKRLSALAFEIIERLKPEREIIITKAISWLLRNLTIQHKKAVAAYIARHKTSLPAIAVRETTRKITTGRK